MVQKRIKGVVLNRVKQQNITEKKKKIGHGDETDSDFS